MSHRETLLSHWPAREAIQRRVVIPDAALDTQREVLDALLAAAREGDFEAAVRDRGLHNPKPTRRHILDRTLPPESRERLCGSAQDTANRSRAQHDARSHPEGWRFRGFAYRARTQRRTTGSRESSMPSSAPCSVRGAARA